jgi:hypothetical protein
MDDGGGHEDMVTSQLAVWQVGNCGDYGTYTLIAANDDSGDHGIFGTDPMLHELAGLTAGNDYYIQLDGHLGAVGRSMLLVVDDDPSHAPGHGESVLPRALEVSEAIPNPSDGSFILRLALPEAAEVQLRLIDVAGREASRRSFGTLVAGRHEIAWTTGLPEARLPRGVYYLEVKAGDRRQVRKLVLR